MENRAQHAELACRVRGIQRTKEARQQHVELAYQVKGLRQIMKARAKHAEDQQKQLKSAYEAKRLHAEPAREKRIRSAERAMKLAEYRLNVSMELVRVFEIQSQQMEEDLRQSKQLVKADEELFQQAQQRWRDVKGNGHQPATPHPLSTSIPTPCTHPHRCKDHIMKQCSNPECGVLTTCKPPKDPAWRCTKCNNYVCAFCAGKADVQIGKTYSELLSMPK